MTKAYLVSRRTNGNPKAISPVIYYYNKGTAQGVTADGITLSSRNPGVRGRPATLPLQLFRTDKGKGRRPHGTWHMWSPELQLELDTAVTTKLLAHGLAAGLPKSDLKAITAILKKNHPELYEEFKG